MRCRRAGDGPVGRSRERERVDAAVIEGRHDDASVLRRAEALAAAIPKREILRSWANPIGPQNRYVHNYLKLHCYFKIL